MVTIFHNPRCSKSRETLKLLEERGIAPVVVEYLKTPPSAETIHEILGKLGLPARALLRKGEDAYRELGLDDPSLSEETLIAAMVEHPMLIERPIVVTEEGARLGRPPEKVLELWA